LTSLTRHRRRRFWHISWLTVEALILSHETKNISRSEKYIDLANTLN
jgi:hypothetical protein